jgi:XTP/dITP diphosphohydrolase
MKRTLVLASNNAGKVREVQQLLVGLDFEVVPQSQHGVPEAAETGLTFIENAILKARNAALHTGSAAIADDSGIEVDALGGAPGVRSARYAGDKASDEDNLRKLLSDMHDVPDVERTARFQCAMAFMRNAFDPMPIIAYGTWEGRLLRNPVGQNGFGYDPIFFVPDHNCSSAQLPPDVKNSLSHRGQALRLLLQQLQQRQSEL